MIYAGFCDTIPIDSMLEECSLTDLPNYVFVYIAGKVIPTVPPEFAIYLVKICFF